MWIKGEAARGAELKEVGVEDLEYHDGPAGARRVVAQESTQQLIGAHEGKGGAGKGGAVAVAHSSREFIFLFVVCRVVGIFDRHLLGL